MFSHFVILRCRFGFSFLGGIAKRNSTRKRGIALSTHESVRNEHNRKNGICLASPAHHSVSDDAAQDFCPFLVWNSTISTTSARGEAMQISYWHLTCSEVLQLLLVTIFQM